jgi:hypothetical protein
MNKPIYEHYLPKKGNVNGSPRVPTQPEQHPEPTPKLDRRFLIVIWAFIAGLCIWFWYELLF